MASGPALTSEEARVRHGEEEVSRRLTIDLSPRAVDLIARISRESGDPVEDIFRKALSLYKIAWDAHARGQAVGSAPSAEALETEFVGFANG